MSAIERISRFLLLASTVGLIAAGCGDSSEPPATPSSPTPAPIPTPEPAKPLPDQPATSQPQGGNVEAGLADYQIYCASCHGQTGAGDGPVAPTLPVQPAKHSDGVYMNALDDAYLFKVIAEGGRAVGKSEMMAPWGGSLTDDQIRNVIAFIRSLADPPYSP